MQVFEIINVQGLESKDLNLFFPVGLPAGHEIVRAGITLEPRFMMMTPNEGTPGSTLIRATVPGIGMSTPTKDLDLVDAGGRTICRSNTEFNIDIEIVEYGVVQCWSRAEDYLDAFDARVKLGDNFYECVNSDTTKCQYKQDNSAETYPEFKTLAKGSDTTLVFTGTGFYTIGYDVTASYKNIMATSVVVDSETQATATFEGGIPIWSKIDQSRDERANLIF
jgi:hypothetical protein